jgi:hypothetical protein
MRYALIIETPKGDAITLLTGEMAEWKLPGLCIEVANVERYIPGLRVSVGGNTVTEMVFGQGGQVSMHGEPTFFVTQ